MFKNALIAAAFVMASSPAFVSAQDFFFSFDEFSRVPTSTVDADIADTGSVFIFADENFDFNQADIDFSVSNPSVVSFTGGTTFNDNGKFTVFDITDPNDSTSVGPTATDGRLFAVSFLSPGIDPANSATDADFRSGANGFLLAQLDYEVVGGGATSFDFTLGNLGVFDDVAGGPSVQVTPTFASGGLTIQGAPVVDPPAPPPVDPPTPPPVDPPTPPPVDPPAPPPVDPPAPPVAPNGASNFFFSFDQNSRAPTATLDSDITDSGSVFIFADAASDFDHLDLDFTNSDSSVVSITGGTTFNADGDFTVLNLSDPNDPNSGPTATDGRLFGVSVETPGVDPANASTDPDFRSGADGILLAQVDFDVVGGGTTDFDFILGGLGVFNDGEQVAVGFESASLAVLGEPVDLPPVQPPVDPPTPPPVDPPTPPVDPPAPPVEPAPQGDPDFFLSFDQNSRVDLDAVDPSVATGSVFIFADENLDFNQLDLDILNDNSSVVSFTGGVVFNDGAPLSGTADSAPGGAFTSFSLGDPDGRGGVTATEGRLFATSLLSPGQVPGSEASNFILDADGFLLAQLDYEIVGEGIANFDFILGDLGVFNDGVGEIVPTLGSATLIVGGTSASGGGFDPPSIPEPSSAILLILGAAGMVARRRRS